MNREQVTHAMSEAFEEYWAKVGGINESPRSCFAAGFAAGALMMIRRQDVKLHVVKLDAEEILEKLAK